MQDNMLLGVIPSEVENLSDLHRINLKKNALSGAIPATIGQNVKIFELILLYNMITGAIMTKLDYLKSLEY